MENQELPSVSLFSGTGKFITGAATLIGIGEWREAFAEFDNAARNANLKKLLDQGNFKEFRSGLSDVICEYSGFCQKLTNLWLTSSGDPASLNTHLAAVLTNLMNPLANWSKKYFATHPDEKSENAYVTLAAPLRDVETSLSNRFEEVKEVAMKWVDKAQRRARDQMDKARANIAMLQQQQQQHPSGHKKVSSTVQKNEAPENRSSNKEVQPSTMAPLSNEQVRADALEKTGALWYASRVCNRMIQVSKRMANRKISLFGHILAWATKKSNMKKNEAAFNDCGDYFGNSAKTRDRAQTNITPAKVSVDQPHSNAL